MAIPITLQAANDPIAYRVRFPAPATHYVEIEAVIPNEDASNAEFYLPVWTPGSYLIREFARNVEAVTAAGEDGAELRIEKISKNRWRVQTEGHGRVHLKYRVYCHELSVRTNWIDDQFALLNGAATFLTLVGSGAREHHVTIELPPGWARSVSAMDSPRANEFVAQDYDTLVDSPIVAGNPAVYEFEVDSKKHQVVNIGEGGVWDGKRSAADVEKIVHAYRRMWGFLPYPRYVFFNLLTESGGGLEHKNSCTLMESKWATRTHKGYLNWLGLVSHEYFHAWNVKRLRPVELGPFDYEQEVYTPSLWVAEGLTEYYGPLSVTRAGLATTEEYLGQGSATEIWPGSIGRLIEALQTTPGRLVQPLQTASRDAWIKLYRPDENTPNVTISYYVKGALAGWLLDATIRRATHDSKSLDDVMRTAYQSYSGERGYTSDQFRQKAQEVAGVDLSGWFHDVLDTTKELEFSEALEWFGLRFKKPDPPKNGAGPKAWMGVQTKTENGRLIITQVLRSGPAFTSGFSADDEILGIDQLRVRPEQWSQRMEQYRPGEIVTALVARGDRLLSLHVTLAAEPLPVWRLEVRPDSNPEQKRHLAAWLGKPADPAR